VDWKTRGWSDALVPDNNFLNGLALTNLAVREWLGLLAYYLTGRKPKLGSLRGRAATAPMRATARNSLLEIKGLDSSRLVWLA